MGKKLTKFQMESEKISNRAVELESEFAELNTKLSEKQCLLNDLLIQRELESDRATEFDKDITKLKRAEKTLQEQISSVTERVVAFKEARNRKLKELRDDAVDDVKKEGEKLLQEYVAKMYDLKQTRGVIIKLLLEMHETRDKARKVTDDFRNLSRQVDDEYERFGNPIPLYNVRALQDTYSGEHAAVLPFQSELQYAIDGRVPAWYDYWLQTGEILSPAEIAAKERK